MLFEPLAIEGAFRILIELMTDERGFFARSFCVKTFAERALIIYFVQRSISCTSGPHVRAGCIIKSGRTPRPRSCAVRGGRSSTSS